MAGPSDKAVGGGASRIVEVPAETLDTALGVILVLIGTKLCLAQMGIETPLWLFAGLLTAWRLGFAVYVILRARYS